jgi:hypothetical protein
VAVSRREPTSVERTDLVELSDDIPAVGSTAPRRRLLSVVVPLLNEEATLEQL